MICPIFARPSFPNAPIGNPDENSDWTPDKNVRGRQSKIQNRKSKMYFAQLLPCLLDKLPHKIHQLRRNLQHFLFEPFPILADLEPRMKFHHFLRIGNKLLILGEPNESLPQRRYRIRRRARRHKGHPGHVTAGDIRRFERLVLDPRRRLSEDLGIDLGKRTKLGKIRIAPQDAVGAKKIVIIESSDNTSFDQLRFYSAAVTWDVLIVVLNFVALHGEPCVVAAVVSGHVIVLQSKYVERETKAQILVAVKGQPSGLESLGFS